jgi:signal transduction histidine kinase
VHRLYLQIYLAFVLILIVFGVLTALAWEATEGGGREETVDSVAQFLGEYMPQSDRPASELTSWLAGINARFPVDLSVFAPDLSLVAQEGRSLMPPDETGVVDRWEHVSGGIRVTLSLPGGRWLVAFHPRNHSLRWLLVPGALVVAVAIGAFPLARRLTGRIERLKERVDDLGAGDLSSRVEVEGRDEIASLAASFNGAANRIENLVNAQRNLLASAPHELRSALTRVRMAVELLPNAPPDVRHRLVRDINELDELIEELLLGSRLEAQVTAPVFEP